jgi:uncharacterized protein
MSDVLINIAQRQKLDKKRILRESIVVRQYSPVLQQYLSSNLITAVIGPRRSGKSSLIHQVLSLTQQEYAYFNFEDELLPLNVSFDQIETALEKIYPNAKYYFFDEIQIYPRWEQALNRLQRSSDKKIIISGSNARLLSTELASVLTGRHESIKVLPFSFREYSQAHNQLAFSEDLLKQYLYSGGFPDVALHRAPQPQNYLRELWDAIVLKDIVQRYHVRNVAGLNSLFTLVRNSLASRLSYRSLEKALQGQLSIATIGKFCGYGENAYLFYLLHNFSFKARERINADKKVYLFDTGYFTSMKIGGQGEYGKLLETLVFLTLYHRHKSNLDFFYYQTKSGKEIDFVLLDNGKPSTLIQVCWSLASEATEQREIEAIRLAAIELQINKAWIVTFNETRTITYNGLTIEAISAEQYLESIDWGYG